jgi:DNA-directed RNA polymerase specialized sigma24 family protein
MLSAKVMEAKTWRNSLNEKDREYMNRVIEKLPQDSRIVIYLHYWLDLEFKDIAEVLGTMLREVEFIHNVTLRLLSKVFRQKLNVTKCQSMEVAA